MVSTSQYDESLTTHDLNSPIFMLIVQLFDLLMLTLKVIPHTTQNTMVTMATNFNSLTPRVGDVCFHMPFPLSGPFLWNTFDYICKAHAIIILKLIKNLNFLSLYHDVI
jgi:hypothetical protein